MFLLMGKVDNKINEEFPTVDPHTCMKMLPLLIQQVFKKENINNKKNSTLMEPDQGDWTNGTKCVSKMNIFG